MYRLWQLWRAVTGSITPADERYIATILTAEEQQLFALLPRYDQRHALDVVQLLVSEGQHDHIVLAGALLHDVGKVSDSGSPLGLVWYGVIVVAQRIPVVYDGLYQWCEPVRRHAAHEQRAVVRAQQVGARPAVIALLVALASHADIPAVRQVHEADDRC